MPSDNHYYPAAETLALYADLLYWLSCQCEDLVGRAPSRRRVAVTYLKAFSAQLSRDAMRATDRISMVGIKKRLYDALFIACHHLPSWVGRTLSRWCVAPPPSRPHRLLQSCLEYPVHHVQDAQ